MVKTPRAGRVKTRLAREIGSAAATSFYRRTIAAVAERLGRDRRWETYLAVTPDAERFARGIPSIGRRIRQGSGDLGARMQRLLGLIARGPVVIVGSDIPGIERCQIAEAFAALGAADVVIGPALDGGYWLVGARRRPRLARLFRRVRWSSRFALADTLEGLVNVGLDVAMVARLSDVDDATDYAEWANRAGRRVMPQLR